MFTLLKKNIYKNWLPVSIFLISLAVRTSFAVTHVVFENDLVRDLTVIQQALDQGSILVGYGPKTSVGSFYTAGFYYHLHALFSLFTHNHPLTMTIVTVVVESFTPVLLFAIFSMYLGKYQSAALSIFFGVSALPVIFGTRAWNPTMIPFFSTLGLYGWLSYLIEKKQRGVVTGIVSTASVFFLHFQGVVLGLGAFFVGVYSLYADRKAIKYWLFGIGLVFVLLIPYFVIEHSQNWQNTQHIIEYYTGEHAAYYDRVSKPEYVFSFIPAFLERVILHTETTWLFIGRTLLFVGLGAGSYVYYFGKKNSKDTKVIGILLVYFLSILLMLRLYKGDKLDYYLSVIFIFPVILTSFITKLFPKIGASIVLVGTCASLFILSRVPFFNQLKTTEAAAAYIVGLEQPVQLVFASESVGYSLSYHLNMYKNVIHLDEQDGLLVWVGSKTDTPPFQAGTQSAFGEYVIATELSKKHE